MASLIYGCLRKPADRRATLEPQSEPIWVDAWEPFFWLILADRLWSRVQLIEHSDISKVFLDTPRNDERFRTRLPTKCRDASSFARGKSRGTCLATQASQWHHRGFLHGFILPSPSIPNPRVKNGTWVTDMASALRADTISRLNDTTTAFERTTTSEMAVVVIRSLDGSSIEEAAARLFEMWGIGKDRDNGLLLLWSTGDRRVRVEVGYGLEGVLPDGKVGAILDAYVIPRFKSGEFDEGIVAGTDALLAAAKNEAVPLPAAASESYEDDSVGSLFWLSLVGAVPVGLGALTAFRKWRRYRRRYCPQCQTRMLLLSDSDDDAMLQEGQVAEERIGSVDYDVWNCPSCSHHFTLRYPKMVSEYKKCPQCSHRTKHSTEHEIEAATTSSSGSARVL